MSSDPKPPHEPELNDRQRKFLQAVAGGMPAQQAAKAAGYSPGYARKASRLLKLPAVATALEAVRSDARREAVYTLLEAVKEIDRAIRFGYEKGNPMSIAKLLEAKGRLFGLYVDRVQIETVDLKGALLEARSRVIDMRTITPGQKLALVSAVLTAAQPTATEPNGTPSVRVTERNDQRQPP